MSVKLNTLELQQFLARRPTYSKNGWFKLGPIDVYIRAYGDKIDLGNCITEEEFLRKGVYNAFVEWLYVTAKVYGYKQVKHENTQNEHLAARHRRRGLRETSDGFTPTFYKDIT